MSEVEPRIVRLETNYEHTNKMQEELLQWLKEHIKEDKGWKATHLNDSRKSNQILTESILLLNQNFLGLKRWAIGLSMGLLVGIVISFSITSNPDTITAIIKGLT